MDILMGILIGRQVWWEYQELSFKVLFEYLRSWEVNIQIPQKSKTKNITHSGFEYPDLSLLQSFHPFGFHFIIRGAKWRARHTLAGRSWIIIH